MAGPYLLVRGRTYSTRGYNHANILRNANGYAQQHPLGLTGGQGGDIYYVENTNASGAGSLTAGMQTAGPLIIKFDPDLDGEDIKITTSANGEIYPHKTIDSRGVNVRIGSDAADSHGIQAVTNGGDKGNLIIIGLTISGVAAQSTSDGFRYALTNQADTHYPVWVTQCTIGDCTDGCLDFTRTNKSAPGYFYLTVSWCKFTGPGAACAARYGGLPIDWTDIPDNNPMDGKTSLIGDNAGTAWDDWGQRQRTAATYHHNYFHGVHERQPRGVNCFIHAYNNYHDKWGRPQDEDPGNTDGKGECYSAGSGCAMRLDNNIIGQYDVDDLHLSYGDTVIHPSVRATNVAPGQLTDNGNVWKAGSEVHTAFSTTFQNYFGTNDIDVPYPYTLEETDPDTFDADVNVSLRNKVASLAGAHY